MSAPASPPPFAPPPAPADFAGRVDELATLEAALAEGGRVAITGGAGVGKTALALAHIATSGGRYRRVAWLHAGEPAALAVGFAALADELEATAGPMRFPVLSWLIPAVRERLAAEPGWLLVLDGVRVPEEAAAFLPHGGPTRVIATSRDERWGGLAREVALGALPMAEGARLLLGRDAAGEDRPGAERLATELEGWPAALVLVRGHVERRGLRPVDAHRALARIRTPGSFDGPPLPRSVRLVRPALAADEPAACRLMDTLSFLAPGVPEATLPGPAANAAAALATLAGSALARRGDGLVVVAESVAEAWRGTLSPAEAEAAVEAALALAAGMIPEGREGPRASLPRLAPALPHALAALAAAESARAALAAAAAFAIRFGTCLLAQVRPEDAAPVLRRALALGELTQGPSHPELAPLLHRLASAYLVRAGSSAEAEALLRRALALTGISGDEKGRRQSYDLTQLLAHVLGASGRREEAEALRRAQNEAGTPPAWMRELRAREGLELEAEALEREGHIEEAERKLRHATELDEADRGPEAALLSATTRLADLLGRTGRGEEAVAIHRRVIGVATVTQKGQPVGRRRLALAELLWTLGRHEEALAEMGRACEAIEAGGQSDDHVLGLTRKRMAALRARLEAGIVDGNG